MKRYKLTLILSLIFIIAFCTNIFASTNTYPRTEEDLGVDKNFPLTPTLIDAALSTPKVDASEKVYDFANLFTDEEELQLYNNINKYIKRFNMDMVIVTIDYNDKLNARDYADDFYDYNNFGIGTDYDGILFLIDMDNREMWISTTGKAIQKYNDERIDEILDDTYNYISDDKYYKCANAFIDSASSLNLPIPAILIFSVIVTLIFISVASSKHKTIAKATQAKQYLLKDSFNLTKNEDRFLHTNTSKVYDPPSSSSGGSSGSSTHSSSSGSSHGGGGRSF